MQTLTREGLDRLRPTIATLADAEGLTAHRLAAELRFEGRVNGRCYVWQPTSEEIARRAGIDLQVIRFDHNTSLLSPAWSAGVAARLAPQLNEYPGADYLDLRRAAAQAMPAATPIRLCRGPGPTS